MKKYILALALLFLCSNGARAQTTPVITLSAAGSSCVAPVTAGSALIINVRPDMGAVSFTINANAGGNTISFYASGDSGKTYNTLSVTPSNSTTTVTSTTTTTAGSVWRAAVSGYTNVCMLMTTQSSGNTTVAMNPSNVAASLGGGGGGAGTVTSVSGTTNQIDSTGGTTPVLSLDTAITSQLPNTVMTTLGDSIYGGASGVATRLAGPTAQNIPYSLINTPSAGVAQAPAWTLPGVTVNSVPCTANAYTVLSTDRGAFDYSSDASACAVTLPNTTGNFVSNFFFGYANQGAGLVTITPTTAHWNGNNSQIVPNHWLAYGYSDNTNYFGGVFPDIAAFPSCADSAGNHLNFTTATGALSCGTSSSGGAGVGYGAGAGSVNVMTVTTSPVIATNAAGTIVEVLPNLANTTTTPTLNVGGAGAQTIVKGPGQTALVASDYNTTTNAVFLSDGTHWQLLNPLNPLVTSISTGTSPCPNLVTGTAGNLCSNEGTTPTGTLTAYDVWWANSSSHCFDAIFNNTDTGCALTQSAAGTFPLTIVSGVSGAVPCFTSTTAESAGTLLATNALVVGGGAGVCPATGNGDFTYATHTLTAAAAGLVDLSAETTATGFKVPVGAGFTSSANGVINYDSTNANTHIRTNGADSLATAEAAAITLNVIPKATDSTHGLITASSITDDAKNITSSEVAVLGNKVFVTGDFTDSTSNTLQVITGLTWTLPTSKAVNVSFHCALLFDQATAAVSDSFGIGVTGTAPTQANASGTAYTSASVTQTGTLTALASTTPTAVVTFTPSAITTIWKAELDGTIEQPSNATPGVFNIYVSTSTGGDNLIVKRGSYCSLF